jgi:membrane protein
MTTSTQQLAKDDSGIHHDAPHFDPAAYDKDSDLDCDNHNHEIVIPKDTDEQPAALDTDRRGGKSAIITEADNPKAI